MSNTKNLALCGLFTALMIAGAYLRIPVPVVPITFQLFFAVLAGLLLGPWRGTAAVGVYILLGLVGLPVFTAGGGPQYVLELSFGYIVGFALAALVSGLIAGKNGKPRFLRLLAAVLAGLAVDYLVGTAYYFLIAELYLHSDVGVWATLVGCVFLPGSKDILLGVLAAVIAARVRPLLA